MQRGLHELHALQEELHALQRELRALQEELRALQEELHALQEELHALQVIYTTFNEFGFGSFSFVLQRGLST